MNKTLQQCTMIELKAMVYDQLVISEQAEKNRQIINQEIAARNEAELAKTQVANKEPVKPLEVLPEAKKE